MGAVWWVLCALPVVFVVVWQVRCALREPLERDRLIRAAHERAAVAREVDDLELLWTLPAYGTGLDRLRQAIRDEQKKEAGDA